MRIYLNQWNILFFLAILVFISQHIYLGSLHFHECDSSLIYEWMKYTNLEKINSHLVEVSPQIFYKIRYFFAEASQTIQFKPINSTTLLIHLYTSYGIYFWIHQDGFI